jgi:hypothetical protein
MDWASAAACVLSAHTLTIGAIQATGQLPLVLAADMVEINGSIDVSSSTQNGTTGAGAGYGCPVISAAAGGGGGGP